MKIGINARNILPKKLEGFGHYSLEITKRICEKHPEHEFVLFFDREIDPNLSFSSNVKIVVLFPPTRHPLLWLIWFDFSIPIASKKHKIDLFWSPDGFCSLISKVPQIITIHDINFEHYPKDMPSLVAKYYQFFFPRFAKKAKKILTVSNYSKNDICKTYCISDKKVEVVYNAPNEIYKPIDKKTQARTRDKYSNGSDYFLFVGSLHPRKNVQRLIEAYQIAKPELRDLKLVIVGSSMWKNKFLDIPQEIENDILFLGHLSLEELSLVMASALALTYVPYFEGFGIPLVEAMKCGIPILAAEATCLPEIAKNSAIYCDPFDVNSISERMIELFNDESLREHLTSIGLERSKDFSWNNSANEVWSILEKEISSLK